MLGGQGRALRPAQLRNSVGRLIVRFCHADIAFTLKEKLLDATPPEDDQHTEDDACEADDDG